MLYETTLTIIAPLKSHVEILITSNNHTSTRLKGMNQPLNIEKADVTILFTGQKHLLPP